MCEANPCDKYSPITQFRWHHRSPGLHGDHLAPSSCRVQLGYERVGHGLRAGHRAKCSEITPLRIVPVSKLQRNICGAKASNRQARLGQQTPSPARITRAYKLRQQPAEPRRAHERNPPIEIEQGRPRRSTTDGAGTPVASEIAPPREKLAATGQEMPRRPTPGIPTGGRS